MGFLVFHFRILDYPSDTIDSWHFSVQDVSTLMFFQYTSSPATPYNHPPGGPTRFLRGRKATGFHKVNGPSCARSRPGLLAADPLPKQQSPPLSFSFGGESPEIELTCTSAASTTATRAAQLREGGRGGVCWSSSARCAAVSGRAPARRVPQT